MIGIVFPEEGDAKTFISKVNAKNKPETCKHCLAQRTPTSHKDMLSSQTYDGQEEKIGQRQD
jgi:hypothetical protein